PDLVQKGLAGIRGQLDKAVGKGKLKGEEAQATISRLKAGALEDARAAQYAVEAVTENEEVKKKVFAGLARAMPRDAVLATNTSSIPITRIATTVPNPERVIGMHFMNPVPVMQLVEIIRGTQTSDATYATTRALAEDEARLRQVLTMAYENILVEHEPSISTITVNRPKALNALNSQTLRELTQAVRECADSRVIILTGAGERAFVAGADIAEMVPMGPWRAREFSELGHVLTALIEYIPSATIAAVNGYALGGGLELAVACDMIFASENARLGLPEVTLGVCPGFGGTQRLVRLVGKLRAKEMIFTGDWVDAKRALEMGLVNAVLPREKLLEHCRSVAGKIAQKGPLAVGRAKRLVERGYDMTLRAANRQEAESFALLFDTDDRREGMRAFVEKRPAKFTGK